MSAAVSLPRRLRTCQARIVLAGAAAAWAAVLAVPAGAAEAVAEYRFDRVADGVFVVPGSGNEPSPQNRGHISNIGILVGAGGVIALGTGPSEHYGAGLIAAIERRFGRPVAAAINLQATADHVLGNAAFSRRGIPIHAHVDTDRFMVQNCTACIRRAAAASEDEDVRVSRLGRPDRLIEAGARIVLAGRTLELIHPGTSFQPGSIAVLDRASGVLFAGDMIGVGRVPDVHNADTRNWIEAIRLLRGRAPVRVVPARGPPIEPERMSETARYLAALNARVEAAYRRGLAIQDASRDADLPDYRNWAQYAALHAANAHFVYLMLEREDLAR
jgi:glyoxylase-like metal-dependent hydrolase (beta-lactamase superfamily II)